MKILVADDEPKLVEALRIMLTGAGYEVCSAGDGASALAVYGMHRPDLVILDIMMPRLDGYEVCASIRQMDPDVPILMLSAKGDIDDKRGGFGAGADDYLTKPFNEEEVLLRVEALLRRRSRGPVSTDAPQTVGLAHVVSIGDLTVDPRRYQVSVRGKDAGLTPKEFQIIALMAGNPGKVFTREDLIDSIWGSAYRDGSISIPVYVRRIREKIEDDPSNPRYLQTVWRFGYRLGD